MTFAKEQNLPAAETGDTTEIALQIAALPKENKKRPNRIVIVTQGKDDVIVVKGSLFDVNSLCCPSVKTCPFNFYADGKVTQHPAISLPREKIVDTNGAGDAFVGGTQ